MGVCWLGVVCIGQVDLKVEVVATVGIARGVASVALDAQSCAHRHGIANTDAGTACLAVVELEHEAWIIGHASNDIFALVLVRAGRCDL